MSSNRSALNNHVKTVPSPQLFSAYMQRTSEAPHSHTSKANSPPRGRQSAKQNENAHNYLQDAPGVSREISPSTMIQPISVKGFIAKHLELTPKHGLQNTQAPQNGPNLHQNNDAPICSAFGTNRINLQHLNIRSSTEIQPEGGGRSHSRSKTGEGLMRERMRTETRQINFEDESNENLDDRGLGFNRTMEDVPTFN